MKNYKLVFGTILLLGIGLVFSSTVMAKVVDVGGGTLDYGVKYNILFQSSRYSNYWHPNFHRSIAIQDNTYALSPGTYYYAGKRWTNPNFWSYAKTGYWFATWGSSNYDYLTF